MIQVSPDISESIMATTTERRRNMRADNCRACGAHVEAGAGYLYRDTHSRPNRYTGRFGWLVKCQPCHEGGKTKLTVRMERDAAARANEPPPPRSWSVAQVRKWAVERGEHEGDVAVFVAGAFGREVVSYRDRINSGFTGDTGYSLEQHEFVGRPLSAAAVADLSPRILAALVAVQEEERVGLVAAAEKLVAAGTAGRCARGAARTS